jgi:transcriptional regulator with PAS, ATPase and Fis domain
MNYYRTDNTLKALSLLIEIKKDWVKKLNPELYYSIVSNIGSCYSALNDFKEAKKCYLQILKYAQKNNIITSLMSAYHSVGHCNLKLKEYSSAIEMLESALKCAEEGNPKKSMYINLTMGEVYLQLNELDSALKILIEADRIASKCADYLTQQSIKDKIAQCYELSGDYKSAHATLLELLDIVKIADKERTKADQETQESKLVTSSKKTHYLYSGGMSFLSHETNETIGLPIIGMTKEIKDVIEKAFLASKSNVNVLILGESGTGKESIAKLIHHSSIRSDNPFVEVNSAVFTTSLAESSLFGHKKGSFTGAVESHKGFIEASHKGTLFFDEIGEMPMEIQSMLLRVLETKEITPLGDSSKKTVDFRLICATNMDVAELAENDKFRFDLYHRINTVEIYLPPLRERKSDIPLLVKYYLQYFANEMNVPVPEISQDALTKLYNYKYPGNIRELKNIVQRMLLFCKNNLIEAENIYISNGEKISGAELTNDNLDLEAIEKKFINLAMARSNNVITNAAKLLGISSFALSRRIKKYELEF